MASKVPFGRMWTYCLTSNNNQHKSKYGNGKPFIFGKWKTFEGGNTIYKRCMYKNQ